MGLAIEGFTNVSVTLSGGVYLLVRKGEVIYVGKAKRMLNRLTAHLSVWAAKKKERIPSWMPIRGIYYDEVLVKPTHPDLIDAEEARLIDLYRPRYNTLLKDPGPTSATFSLIVAGHALTFNRIPEEPMRRRV